MPSFSTRLIHVVMDSMCLNISAKTKILNCNDFYRCCSNLDYQFGGKYLVLFNGYSSLYRCSSYCCIDYTSRFHSKGPYKRISINYLVKSQKGLDVSNYLQSFLFIHYSVHRIVSIDSLDNSLVSI